VSQSDDILVHEHGEFRFLRNIRIIDQNAFRVADESGKFHIYISGESEEGPGSSPPEYPADEKGEHFFDLPKVADRALDHGRDLRLFRHVAGDADRLEPGGKGILRKLALFGRSRVAKNALIVAEMFPVLIRLCALDDRVIREPY